ncbi:hypothetical protein JUJ52_19735 [Virgibacillus sp. AGTR]|uniref:hypothetical protein n=1 Tax=Virgibacillus sp. AGTR TaxID=2812055 RepID=UPI001D169F20|nr:hypothetical protein [Virgibacillus sp. AGTR]MCC2252165.1 hypothetical protein [Virgibacillus sp. AGTR]
MTVIADTKQTNQLTKNNVMNAKRVANLLRATKHRLYAYKSEGRYICRVVDKNGNVAGISSRSTLEGAVTIAVGNIQ